LISYFKNNKKADMPGDWRKGPIRPFDFEVRVSGFFLGEPFRIRITPEGLERIRVTERPEVREPSVEVSERDDELLIVAEVPGVEKERIEIEATEDSLRISASNHGRKYQGEVSLPAKVDPKSGKAVYRNGLLEIRLKKLEGRKGERISVE